MKNTKNPSNPPVRFIYLLMLIPLAMFGLMGAGLQAISGKSPLEGFMWGIITGIVILSVVFLAMHGWEWIKKRMNEGRLFPYILLGFLGAVALCAYFALTLGDPTCTDSDSDPRGGCVEYADDGFKPSDAQRWAKFWNSLPIATVITCLIAALVHSKSHGKK